MGRRRIWKNAPARQRAWLERHRKPINYNSFLRTTIKQYASKLAETFTTKRPILGLFFDRPPVYLGRRGPVTFTGTPASVLRSLRRWQKGLEP